MLRNVVLNKWLRMNLIAEFGFMMENITRTIFEFINRE